MNNIRHVLYQKLEFLIHISASGVIDVLIFQYGTSLVQRIELIDNKIGESSILFQFLLNSLVLKRHLESLYRQKGDSSEDLSPKIHRKRPNDTKTRNTSFVFEMMGKILKNYNKSSNIESQRHSKNIWENEEIFLQTHRNIFYAHKPIIYYLSNINVYGIQ